MWHGGKHNTHLSHLQLTYGTSCSVFQLNLATSRRHHLANVFSESNLWVFPSDLILFFFKSPAASSCPQLWPFFPHTLYLAFLTSSHSSHQPPFSFLPLISSWWSTVSPSVATFPLMRLSQRPGRCAAGVKYTPPKYTSASLKYTSDRSLESAGWVGQLITSRALTPDQAGSLTKIWCIKKKNFNQAIKSFSYLNQKWNYLLSDF